MMRSALPALLTTALLSACATAPAPAPAPYAAITPLEQFTVQVRPAADEIQLAPHGVLSANQHAALGALVMRWRDAGQGPIVVQAPASGRGADTGHAVMAALRGFGVPAGGARVQPVEPQESAPVRVGFSRYEAVGPDCGAVWSDAVRTADNRPMASFGCAVTANVAAQIADPRDLVEPQPAAAADARRRVFQANSYVQGKQPSESGEGGGSSR